MNTSMKDEIKRCMAIGLLLIAIIIVVIIIVQYQIEGEQNMPYKLSKITIISTAEGEQNTENTEETARWNLTINQNNDIYFFIDKNSDNKEDLIENVTISNINIIKNPTKGTIKTFMPSSVEGRTFTYDESYLVNEKLEFKGAKNSNPKTLEIGSQGGSVQIRFSNTNIGALVSNEDVEIKHDGTLLSRIGVAEEEIKFTVNFDFIMQINNIKYKSNITLALPCENLITEGTTTKEILCDEENNNIVFKRIK